MTNTTVLSAGLPSVLLALALLFAGCSDAPPDLGNAGAAEANAGPIPPRGSAWVIFGTDTVLAEVADTQEARQQGLMFRESLEPGRGMLFVFDQQDIRSFWMRNTYIPLDIAFLDQTQRIVDIQQMEPETEEYHYSSEPALFALEVIQGWFEAEGISVGDRAQIVFGPR